METQTILMRKRGLLMTAGRRSEHRVHEEAVAPSAAEESVSAMKGDPVSVVLQKGRRLPLLVQRNQQIEKNTYTDLRSSEGNRFK